MIEGSWRESCKPLGPGTPKESKRVSRASGPGTVVRQECMQESGRSLKSVFGLFGLWSTLSEGIVTRVSCNLTCRGGE